MALLPAFVPLLFFVLIDNLRFDQWKAIQHIFAESFRILDEDTFYAILPTATQYARNAIFAGMLPIDIEKNFSNQWKNDDEEGGKNLHEEEFLKEQLKRNRLGDIKFSYTKITNNNDGQKLVENMHNLLQNDFNVIVYNFVDMLSHARTEMEVLKELAGDETSYRSITMSWFEHSPLHQALKKIADKNINLIIATDHGSTRVKTPVHWKSASNFTLTPSCRPIRNSAFPPTCARSMTYTSMERKSAARVQHRWALLKFSSAA